MFYSSESLAIPANFRMALIFTDFQQEVVGPIYLHCFISVNIRAILSKVEKFQLSLI